MKNSPREFSHVDFQKIQDLLFNDEKYISEFSEAAIDSFVEFSENYKKFILHRDETNFRKAGHKIKPVAKMIGVNELVEEYEHGKKLIQNGAEENELLQSSDRIKSKVDNVISELEKII